MRRKSRRRYIETYEFPKALQIKLQEELGDTPHGRGRPRRPARVVPRLPLRRRPADRDAVQGRRRGLARDDPDDPRVHLVLPAGVRSLPPPQPRVHAGRLDGRAAGRDDRARRQARPADGPLQRRHGRRARGRHALVLQRPAAPAHPGHRGRGPAPARAPPRLLLQQRRRLGRLLRRRRRRRWRLRRRRLRSCGGGGCGGGGCGGGGTTSRRRSTPGPASAPCARPASAGASPTAPRATSMRRARSSAATARWTSTTSCACARRSSPSPGCSTSGSPVAEWSSPNRRSGRRSSRGRAGTGCRSRATR